MAVNNTTGSFASMEFPMAFSRQDSFPMDKSSVYGSLSAAQTYAQTSPLAYVGQVIAVVVDGTATIYQIKNTAGDLERAIWRHWLPATLRAMWRPSWLHRSHLIQRSRRCSMRYSARMMPRADNTHKR